MSMEMGRSCVEWGDISTPLMNLFIRSLTGDLITNYATLRVSYDAASTMKVSRKARITASPHFSLPFRPISFSRSLASSLQTLPVSVHSGDSVAVRRRAPIGVLRRTAESVDVFVRPYGAGRGTRNQERTLGFVERSL